MRLTRSRKENEGCLYLYEGYDVFWEKKKHYEYLFMNKINNF